MLSSQFHPQRRPVPHPSPSLVAMQRQGLELTTRKADSKLSSNSNQHQFTDESPLSQDHTEPLSPSGSHLTRSSSIYSTESVHSDDSARTTISQILDMYIDIISKLPCDGGYPEATVAQPIAYCDTIAPLLRRRFSTESGPRISISEMESHPMLPILPLQTWKKSSQTSLSSSYRQAPGFQEFSRNLRGRRAELVSPLTVTSSDLNSQLNLDAASDPSPTSPQMRPFSFVGNEKAGHEDCRAVSPLLQRDMSSDIPSTNPGTDRIVRDGYGEWILRPVGIPESAETRYVNSQDLLAQKLLSQQAESSNQAQPSSRSDETSRFYRHRSTGSRSTGSFVMYPGIGETVKAIIKDKIQRRKEAKDTASILTTASHKYPAMQQHRADPSDGRRRSSLKNSVEQVLSRISIAGPPDPGPAVAQPQPEGRQAAMPFTPHQKYGADIRLAKNKGRRREEHRQAHRSQEVRSEHRPTSSDIYHPGHRRAYSAKTTETGRSPTTPAKRKGLIAAVESAKHSLTHSSADKRRDKLKESIVVVGPTQLTIANAQLSADALQ